jgi:hypothetical protein
MAHQYVQTGKILDILLSPTDSHKASLKSLIYSEEKTFTNVPALQVLVTEILKCVNHSFPLSSLLTPRQASARARAGLECVTVEQEE